MSWVQSKRSIRSWASLALGCLAFVFALVGCKTFTSSGVTQATVAVPASPPASSLEPTQPAPGPSPQAVEARSQDFALPTPGDPALALVPAARQDINALKDPTRYTIALNIDPSLQSFQGRLRVEFTNQEEVALDEVYFRLLPNGHKSYGDGSLAVSEVLLNGEVATSQLSLQDTVLKVHLPDSLSPGESVEIELAFDGQVPLDFGSGTAGYGIYNLALTDDVLALSGWYPILAVYDEQGWNLDPVSEIGDSVYSDTALYSVKVCAPETLTLAATGSSIDEQSSDGRTCTQLESGPTRDFFLVASPNFKVDSQQVDGVTINAYSLPGHEGVSRQALDIAADSVSVFNQKFGQYPFAELDMVAAPMRNALGVEYPGVFLVGDSLYDKPDEPEFAITIAHEAAHQWWYSVVGNDVFDSPWLDEGLTSYSSSLYYEFDQSPEFARGLFDFWQQRYDRLKKEGKDDQVTASLEHFENQGASNAYGTVVYVKAALFFRALRQEIGDEAFFTALQRYYQEHKYGIATPADLLKAFEETSGRSLEAFYNEWLYFPAK